MSKYRYFPGCAIKDRGGSCETSLLEVSHALGIELEELEDWNCCGASGYSSQGDPQSLAMVARNLAVAERSGDEKLMTPCAACHRVLNKTKHHMGSFPDVRTQVCAALAGAGLKYKGTQEVKHALEVLVEDVGEQAIAGRVVKPLNGLRVAPYYGCQYAVPTVNDESDMGPLERLLSSLGAEVINHPGQTHCCGGVHLMERYQCPPQAVEALIHEAQDLGAEVIATICPACQFNLERSVERMANTYGAPSISIVYVAQLLGAALGLKNSQLGVGQGRQPAD
jgi:heterodisulfide reductase subunit B